MTKRKSKRHNPEQIVRKLRGETVGEKRWLEPFLPSIAVHLGMGEVVFQVFHKKVDDSLVQRRLVSFRCQTIVRFRRDGMPFVRSSNIADHLRFIRSNYAIATKPSAPQIATQIATTTKLISG